MELDNTEKQVNNSMTTLKKNIAKELCSVPVTDVQILKVGGACENSDGACPFLTAYSPIQSASDWLCPAAVACTAKGVLRDVLLKRRTCSI